MLVTKRWFQLDTEDRDAHPKRIISTIFCRKPGHWRFLEVCWTTRPVWNDVLSTLTVAWDICQRVRPKWWCSNSQDNMLTGVFYKNCCWQSTCWEEFSIALLFGREKSFLKPLLVGIEFQYLFVSGPFSCLDCSDTTCVFFKKLKNTKLASLVGEREKCWDLSSRKQPARISGLHQRHGPRSNCSDFTTICTSRDTLMTCENTVC